MLITLDRDAITIAINNLIENAVKYSGESKEIDINMNGDNTLSIDIKDRGIGISKTEKSKIFSKFYRVGSEDTRTTKGTGLGLYITQQIIQGLGAKISIADNQPQGSIFTISIPTNV